jgi:pimeloyl-ACP methyl ester carboxylesterase
MGDIPAPEASEHLDSRVEHMVILVHGIRTDAPWQITLRSELEKAGIRVELTNYGYFDMFRFLVPARWVRETAISRVWTLIRDVRKMYPGPKMSFLAHSYGTFIVAQLLRREFDFKVHRIMFCGSIVPYNFPFHEISERFTAPLVSEVGSADYLPAVAESITWGYGSAGTYGFRIPRVKDRWHNKFSHSKFLTPEFCSHFWVPFFVNGTIVDADRTPERSPFYVRLISRIPLEYIIVCALSAWLGLSIPPIVGKPSYERATLDLNGVQYTGHVMWDTLIVPPEFGELPILHVQGRG